MAQRPKKKKTGRVGRVAFAALVVAAILALAFFLVLRTQNQTSIAENAIGTIVSPIQSAFSGITGFVRDTLTGVMDYVTMTDNLDKSRQEVIDLKLQLLEYEEAAKENVRLKELIGAKERYEQLDPLPARVIARNSGVWLEGFSINKGATDGVSVNNAIITGDGLVGIVYEVGQTYAKVRSIIDERSAVTCLIERTRDPGVMSGRISVTSEIIECYMRYLPPINDVSPGDIAITSGQDKIFPKGIPVATVTQVARQQSDTSDRYIMVTPTVDFLHLEEVLVLRTKVDTDTDEHYSPLLTPTPKPTAIATPTPAPTPNIETPSGALDQVFSWPDGQLNEEGELIESATPPPSINQTTSGTLIEDEWAQ